MAESESRFTVSVAAEGVEQTKRKLEDLERVGAKIGRAPAQAFGAAAAGLEKMSAAADRLVAQMERLDGLMLRTGQGAQRASSRGLPEGVTSVTAVTARARAPGPVVAAARAQALETERTKKAAEQAGIRSLQAQARAHQGAAKMHQADQADAEQAAGGTVEDYERMMKRIGRQGPGGAGAPRQQGAASHFGFGLAKSFLPGGRFMLGTGRGAFSEAAGMALGTTASALSSIPLAGSSGLSGALGVLGPLSLPFQRFVGNSESALSLQRQQLQMAPLLGRAGLDFTGGGLTDRNIAARGQRAVDYGFDRNKTVSALESLRTSRVKRGIAEAGQDPMTLMGASAAEGQAFIGQLAAAGGNRGDQMSAPFTQTAMAARTVLGVDASTTGAFALAGRTGAVAGGNRDANQLLLQAINQANSLNLSGADAQNYLQRIAEGIREFQTTGMPLQMDAMRNLTAGFTGMGGMSPLAAQKAATGMLASSQAFLSQGATSGAEILQMRNAGFTGGLDSYLATKRTMGTNPEIYTSSALKTLPSLAAGPSREVALEAVSEYLGPKGINDPRAIAQIVDDLRNGEDPAAAFAAATKTAAGKPPVTQASLLARATDAISPEMSAAANRSNQSVAMGMSATALTAELEGAANDSASAMARFGGGLRSIVQFFRQAGDQVFGGDDVFPGSPGVRSAN